MTLEEMKACEKTFVTAQEAAPVIGCNVQTLRATARENPDRLGFPVSVVGKRVHIPRLPFIHFVEGAGL